jgi:hypothetical protein
MTRLITNMSVPALKLEPQHLIATFTERHDTLRMIMEWIADRFADTAEETDTSIDWEDGEEHDEPVGPATL